MERGSRPLRLGASFLWECDGVSITVLRTQYTGSQNWCGTPQALYEHQLDRHYLQEIAWCRELKRSDCVNDPVVLRELCGSQQLLTGVPALDGLQGPGLIALAGFSCAQWPVLCDRLLL